MNVILCWATALAATCAGEACARHSASGHDSAAVATPSAVAATVATHPSRLPADVPARPPTTSAAEPLDASDSADALRVFGSGLIIPVQGVVASELRDSYMEPRSGHSHQALDIMAPRGTPVLSATGGRLLKLFTSIPGGTMVYAADSSDQFILMYGHLDRYADGMVNGMPLRRGQVIGYVGSTGDADAGAPHLHFAIERGHPSVAWWKGEPVNPFLLLTRR